MKDVLGCNNCSKNENDPSMHYGCNDYKGYLGGCFHKTEINPYESILYFSVSANLLCTKNAQGEFWVENGGWNLSDYPFVLSQVDDWVEYTREEFVKLFPNFGY